MNTLQEREAWIGSLVYAMYERDEGQVRVYRITGYSAGHSQFNAENIATGQVRQDLHVSDVARLAPIGGQVVPAGAGVDLGRDQQGRVLRTWISEDIWRERYYEISLDSGTIVTVRATRVHLICAAGWLFRRDITVDAAHQPVIVEVEHRGDDERWYREHVAFDVVADYEAATLSAAAESLAEAEAAITGRPTRASVMVPLQPDRFGYAAAQPRVLATA